MSRRGHSTPFWEMLELLAREPGMEWLELGLAGEAAARAEAVAHRDSPGQNVELLAGEPDVEWLELGLAGEAAGRAEAAAHRDSPGQRADGGAAVAGEEFGSSQKHPLGSSPLKTLSFLEFSGDNKLWETYLEGLKKFLAFRESMGMPAAWPIPEEQVRGFLAAESPYSSSNTLMYMAALTYLSKLTGNPDPLEDAITRRMVVGLKRRAGILRDKYLPITIEVLRSLLGVLETVCITHYECLLFRALFTVAFFGALRIGELVAKHHNVLQPELLYLSDLQLLERRAVFHLPASAESQVRHVISLGLSGEPWVCPVLALRNYVTARSREEGPLFMHWDNETVTKREFLTVLRWSLQLLGLSPEHYGVHSFWVGAAITAARCGFPGEDITRLSRWPCMFPGR